MECIVCLESKNNLYKCEQCVTRICEDCYKGIKSKSCIVCNQEIFNKTLDGKFPKEISNGLYPENRIIKCKYGYYTLDGYGSYWFTKSHPNDPLPLLDTKFKGVGQIVNYDPKDEYTGVGEGKKVGIVRFPVVKNFEPISICGDYAKRIKEKPKINYKEKNRLNKKKSNYLFKNMRR